MTTEVQTQKLLDLPTPKENQWLLRGVHLPSYAMGQPGFEQQIELFDGHDMACIPLDDYALRASLKLRNHSPSGFAWGYGGSGPAQLALATLLEVNAERALGNYQRFKFAALCQTPWDEDLYVLFDPMAFLAGDDTACRGYRCGRIHPPKEGT